MDISEITLKTPTGDDVALSTLAGRPVAVQLVRYFGCLPCQQYLQEFSAQCERFAEQGVQSICVGGSADYQARWLAENGIEIPMLLDPDQDFREAVGFGDIGWNLLHPGGAVRYLRAFGKGRRPMKITSDTTKTPGAVVLDADLKIAWRYEGRTLGDYPELDEFFSEAAKVATAQGG